MKVPFYLIVKESGSVRVTKNRPGVNFDEIAIKVNLEYLTGFLTNQQLRLQ